MQGDYDEFNDVRGWVNPRDKSKNESTLSEIGALVTQARAMAAKLDMLYIENASSLNGATYILKEGYFNGSIIMVTDVIIKNILEQQFPDLTVNIQIDRDPSAKIGRDHPTVKIGGDPSVKIRRRSPDHQNQRRRGPEEEKAEREREARRVGRGKLKLHMNLFKNKRKQSLTDDEKLFLKQEKIVKRKKVEKKERKAFKKRMRWTMRKL